MTGLLGGVIPRASALRGSCVIRGSAPHFWVLAAEAMNLRVLWMSWADRVFSELMTASGIRAAATPLEFCSRGHGRGWGALTWSSQTRRGWRH